MNKKEYRIEFNKVLSGDNSFEFQLTPEFLASMGAEDMEGTAAVADTMVHKSTSMYTVTVHLKGSVRLVCDTCLDEFDYPLDYTSGLIIKLSETERYDDDEIIYITPATVDIDLSQFLFDCVMLGLPTRRTCSLTGKSCNPEITEKLDHLHQEEGEETEDPRWEELKKLKK